MKFESLLTADYKKRYEKTWHHTTIIDYLKRAIANHPQKWAIIDSKSRYTYEELGQLVNRVALGLHHHGIKKDDVVSIYLPNWNEFVILHFAITKLGAITNPLIPIYREREIDYMIKKVKSKALIIPDVFREFNYPKMIENLLPQWPFMDTIFVVGTNYPPTMKNFTNLSEIPWEKQYDHSVLDLIVHDANDITEIIFTSGTTGSPKGVMHSHNTLSITANYWMKHLHLTSDDVLLMPSTFAHQTGFCYGVQLPSHFAGTAVYLDNWNPDDFLSLIEQEQVTITAGATPFVQDTIYAKNLNQYNISSLKTFIALGAPIPRRLIQQATDNPTIQFKILAGWGQTENGLVTLTSFEDHEDKLINSDGYPLYDMELKIVDAQFNEVPKHTEGSLLCRGPALFIGYFGEIEKTRSEFYEDWFITGDLAIMDDDGYIRISGRAKDIIIRGGENIPISYIENILFEHDGIAAVQLVAIPDKRLQEKAAAIVLMHPNNPPLCLEEMQQFLQQKGVAKNYWPEYLEVLDTLPRTASGKIQKYKLRSYLLKKLGKEDAKE
ncbi:AMP-binding protein [Kurthia sibirica]|uniref:Cyclohexanecarboxylate-CoA ligase n=1 Tax=Kurthia sibirica TaxID=202750 RepID=A0A2U3ANG4_9BACL|nr:AMP-binding protein [Kurthia sibirica]PWI26083.1 cyclohexanecarboxylate-CoA ligase [Kurthia sibirica]GEK35155.1 cyclohexanecarboxylate-CoA ligase [Kurthia sibirica]